jgi:hypothetical protein
MDGSVHRTSPGARVDDADAVGEFRDLPDVAAHRANGSTPPISSGGVAAPGSVTGALPSSFWTVHDEGCMPASSRESPGSFLQVGLHVTCEFNNSFQCSCSSVRLSSRFHMTSRANLVTKTTVPGGFVERQGALHELGLRGEEVPGLSTTISTATKFPCPCRSGGSGPMVLHEGLCGA